MNTEVKKSTYVADACISMSQLKDKINQGAYGNLTKIKNPTLYKNEAKKWRLKFEVCDKEEVIFKKINLLATVVGKSTYVNSKSFEFSCKKDEAEINSLAIEELMA